MSDRDRIYDLGGHMKHNHPSPVVRVKPSGATTLEMAVPTREGQPIDPGSDLIVTDGRGGYYAEPLTARRASARSGPAQVATAAYRDNYETIFGARATRGQA